MTMSQKLTQEDEGIGSRIRSNPRPALIWVVGALALLALEFGAIVQLVTSTVPGVGAIELPTLLTRELIPNQGYQLPNGSWQGTFLGLSPAIAWLLRVVLVYAYAFVWVAWVWYGYLTFGATTGSPTGRRPTIGSTGSGATAGDSSGSS